LTTSRFRPTRPLIAILALTAATLIPILGIPHVAARSLSHRQPAATPSIPLPRTVTPVPGWLHTDGTRIVDAQGRAVKIMAINWYGAETSDFVPGGLDRRPYMDILLTIKALGFNTIRLPFSNEMVERNPRVVAHLGANPKLRGRRALDILDAIIAGARKSGLMVILDNHRSEAGWSALGNGLWYTPRYPESAWLHDWTVLARRYARNPAMIGVDLRNEPHSNGPGLEILSLGYLRQGATWGPYYGRDNPASDWQQAAQRGGDAVLRANPHLLIFVEGTEIYPNPNGTPDIYWWGGNLRGAMDYPVRLALPHHLVYSAHEYGPGMHDQRWFTPHMTERTWQQQFERHWGFLLARQGPDAAPVWIGEFGTSASTLRSINDTRPASQGQWFRALVHYLHRTNTGWAYWAINGTTSTGPSGRRAGLPDSFGLLTPDWRHLSFPPLMQALRSIES
jgi:endoglucanase